MLDLKTFSNSGFDRGRQPWIEVAWWLVRWAIFATSLPIPSGFKVGVLRFFGAQIGKGVVIRSRVNITFPWRFKCGDHVWIGDEVLILNLENVTLGSNVCISQRAFLCTGSHDFNKSTFDLITQPIVVESGCWIGASSFICPGVRFEVGSRCLAGSVVTRNIKSQATVAGVPARSIE